MNIMLKTVEYPSPEAEERLAHIAGRKSGADKGVEDCAREILRAVRTEGDEALLRYTRQFDAPNLPRKKLTVSESEIKAAYKAVTPEFLEILRAAIANVEAFHRHQLRTSHFITHPDGTFLGQMVRPVAAAGLYIPGGTGGTTPLISSAVMNGVPARLAGVKDIALITPPKPDGTVNPHLLVAAAETGVTRIHRSGSAWAIAALAYGTESIPKVDVVVGPGNIYVATAKKLVAGEVGTDTPAGPSEILVVADDAANANYIAADLLSQAEHDVMASSVLITTDAALAERVGEALTAQLERLPRKSIAAEALQRYGAAFLVENLSEALALSNRIAPEHLELMVRNPWDHLGKVEHAGAVFLGEHTPEAVGDYFAGPNHVLPTAGTARFASALGVENFIKKTSVIAYSGEAFQRDAASIVRLAELEGLEAHAASIRIRMEKKS